MHAEFKHLLPSQKKGDTNMSTTNTRIQNKHESAHRNVISHDFTKFTFAMSYCFT